jgi:hypothetical protein
MTLDGRQIPFNFNKDILLLKKVNGDCFRKGGNPFRKFEKIDEWKTLRWMAEERAALIAEKKFIADNVVSVAFGGEYTEHTMVIMLKEYLPSVKHVLIERYCRKDHGDNKGDPWYTGLMKKFTESWAKLFGDETALPEIKFVGFDRIDYSETWLPRKKGSFVSILFPDTLNTN